MSAHVLLTLLYKLRKRECEACQAFYLFHNEFNKLNEALMMGSIYHMLLNTSAWAFIGGICKILCADLYHYTPSWVWINKTFERKIVNICLPIRFSIWFGCPKETSH